MFKRLIALYKELGQRSRIIIISSLLVLLVLSVIIVGIINRRSAPGYTVDKIDPDTGEILRSNPNRVDETADSRTQVLVIGLTNLADQSVTSTQIYQVSEALVEYTLSDQFPEGVEVLKIVDPKINYEQASVFAKLKYGDNGPEDDLQIRLETDGQTTRRGYDITLIITKDGKEVFKTARVLELDSDVDSGDGGYPFEGEIE